MKKQILLSYCVGVLSALVLIYFAIATNLIERKVEEKIVEKIVKSECPGDKDSELLPAPVLISSMPKIIETNKEGEARVRWDPVPGAEKYIVYIKDLKGKVVKVAKTPHFVIYLKDIRYDEKLDFTPYTFQIVTVNKKGIEGPPGEVRQLNARRLQSVLAPTIKSISIED